MIRAIQSCWPPPPLPDPLPLPPSPCIGARLQGALFVEGFTDCGVEFHLQHLFKEHWPAGCAKHLATWDRDRPERLTQVLDANGFQLIVLAAKTGGWEYD